MLATGNLSTLPLQLYLADQKFKEPSPTPSRGLARIDKLWVNDPQFIYPFSVPSLGAGLGVGEREQLAFN